MALALTAVRRVSAAKAEMVALVSITLAVAVAVGPVAMALMLVRDHPEVATEESELPHPSPARRSLTPVVAVVALIAAMRAMKEESGLLVVVTVQTWPVPRPLGSTDLGGAVAAVASRLVSALPAAMA